MFTRDIKSLGARIRLSEQRAISTHWLSILLQDIRVEELALKWRIFQKLIEQSQPQRDERNILSILSKGISGAESGVIRTGEESLSQGGSWVRVSLGSTTALFGCCPTGLGWGCDGFGVSVGTGNDDFEIVTHLTGVSGGCGIDAGSPEGTLVVCDGGWVGAIIRWVDGWITFNVDIETCA